MNPSFIHSGTLYIFQLLKKEIMLFVRKQKANLKFHGSSLYQNNLEQEAHPFLLTTVCKHLNGAAGVLFHSSLMQNVQQALFFFFC